MTTWTGDELNRVGKAEELEIESLRKDGTLRKPVIIWMVRVDDDIYIRCVNGRAGTWFRHAQTCHAGRIRAGGVEKDVSFVEVTDPGINESIDAAYRTKYARYPQYVAPLFKPEARAATLKLVPRS